MTCCKRCCRAPARLRPALGVKVEVDVKQDGRDTIVMVAVAVIPVRLELRLEVEGNLEVLV